MAPTNTDRDIKSVIVEVQVLLPNPPPAEVADQILALNANLNILLRESSYTPPESPMVQTLWNQLGILLYRFMPKPTAYEWAAAVSVLVTQTLVVAPIVPGAKKDPSSTTPILD